MRQVHSTGIAILVLSIALWVVLDGPMGPDGLPQDLGAPPTIQVDPKDMDLHGEPIHRAPASSILPRPGDCGFFDAWKGLPALDEPVAGLLESVRPLGSGHLACLPTEWIFGILTRHCDGRLLLATEEIAASALELRNRHADWGAKRLARGESGSPLSTWIRPDQMDCLVDALSMDDPDPGGAARTWGRLLGGIFAGQGSLFGMNESALAHLRNLVVIWPIREDEWWRGFWEGTGGADRSTSAVPLRIGVIEVLHGLLPESEWLARVDHLASLLAFRGSSCRLSDHRDDSGHVSGNSTYALVARA